MSSIPSKQELGGIKSVTIAYEHGTLTCAGEAAQAWERLVDRLMVLQVAGHPIAHAEPGLRWEFVPNADA